MDYDKEVVATFRRQESNELAASVQDIKQILLKNINENPGIWYRELLRLTGISNGNLAHHLRALEESSRIRVLREDKLGKTRYYALDITDSESNIIGFLRNNTAKQIMMLILDQEFCTFSEIVEWTAKSPSTVSWHLKRLTAGGIVVARLSDSTLYSLADSRGVLEILSKYKRSFLDKAANSYEEIIDGL